jgi:hypothetical protein
MTETPAVPDSIQRGVVPDGAVMRFYDHTGRLILERTLAHTRGTDWLRPAEACAAVDAGLAGLLLVVFDGDTGVRLPMIFRAICQLRPVTTS